MVRKNTQSILRTLGSWGMLVTGFFAIILARSPAAFQPPTAGTSVTGVAYADAPGLTGTFSSTSSSCTEASSCGSSGCTTSWSCSCGPGGSCGASCGANGTGGSGGVGGTGATGTGAGASGAAGGGAE